MQVDRPNLYHNSFNYFTTVEESLAASMGLSDLTAGRQIIRNEKGWRENEKNIAYVWIVAISKSFAGDCYIFSIKFIASKFRDVNNPEEIIQGIFTFQDSHISNLYYETVKADENDIINTFNFNLSDANKGITIDGVNYAIRVIALNTDTFVIVHNPNTTQWQQWEKSIWQFARKLAKSANNNEFSDLFTY